MRIFLTTLLLVVAVAAGAADFTVHEGPNVFIGEGGEKTAHDGVDFWLNGGSPPRSFELLRIPAKPGHRSDASEAIIPGDAGPVVKRWVDCGRCG